MTMTARAPGTVISTSRFHLGTRWGGQRTRTRLKPAMMRGGGGDEGLAGAHLADDGGAPVGFEGEDRCLRPRRALGRSTAELNAWGSTVARATAASALVEVLS